ncbi:MAG: CCA tRNA nucleotidyltransferase [Pseudomonadota bacterium]
MAGVTPVPEALAQRFAWVDAPACRAVVAALEATEPDCARFVGGCVRDAVLGREIADIDIATSLAPEETMAALAAAGLRRIPTGIDHGTVTAVIDGAPFEITSLRADVATDGRHASVAFTQDWDADWRRRDFTMNAIYVTPDKSLYDPAGGVADALEGRIRFIGDPTARIREDYLRILRFYRFNARFGREIDMAGAAACAAEREGMRRLSAERIRMEMVKLLVAPKAPAALERMAADGVLAEIWPTLTQTDVFSNLAALEEALALPAEAMRRLAALASDDGAALARRLRLSNAETATLVKALAAVEGLHPDMDAAAARRAAYWAGRQAFCDGLLLIWARSGADATDASWRAFWDEMSAWEAPVFPLKGADILAAGGAAGPEVGRVLETLETWWADADFPEEPALRAKLSEVMAGE